MVIKDRIYGKFTITSPVLIDLIKSKPVQRLKGIAQYGVPDQYYHLKNYSRYEHSIGVMLLLMKLGASEEEQIAGLLHDVSHTAFSHIIDWVLGDPTKEDYQDSQHQKFLTSSEIPGILKKYKYNPERVFDYKNFGLLERNIPDVCADRLDYSLREFPPNITKRSIESLVVKNGKIVFKNKSSALLFAKSFLKQQVESWGGFETDVRYRFFADALRIALEKKIVNLDDFWKDDKFIMHKLEAAKDEDINKIFSVLRKKSLDHLPKSGEIIQRKFRHVDPQFADKDKLPRLSEVDKPFKNMLIKAREQNKKGIRIPIY